MTRNELAERLAEHPRLIGALFTAMLLLANWGMAAANNYAATNGT